MKQKQERSAGGIVYRIREDESIDWLITQHSLHKGWGFPKGIVGDVVADEPMEEAAVREVGEEGGIVAEIVDAEPVSVQYSYRFQDTLIDKTVTYYLMRYLSGDPNDHDWEVSEALFLSEKEIKQRLTFDSDKEAFEAILLKYQSLE